MFSDQIFFFILNGISISRKIAFLLYYKSLRKVLIVIVNRFHGKNCILSFRDISLRIKIVKNILLVSCRYITYINVSKPFDHFGRHFEIFGDGMINLIEIMHFDFTYLAIKIPFIVIGTITETT